MSDWLKEEGSLDASALLAPAKAFRSDPRRGGAPELRHNLAVFITPLIVRETGKWFGDAELRLDALVVHGGGDDTTLYHPQTFRFPRVADGDDLAGDERGLLIYLGRPAHFLTFSLMLARDRKDSDDLSQLLQASARSSEFESATAALAGAALPSAEAAALQTGLRAALALGDLAYKLIREVSPRCLGLFRASWLAEKDRFGVGRHPRSGAHEVKDFRMGYRIELDRAR